MTMMTRRDFLGGAAASAAGAVVLGTLPVRSAPAQVGGDKVVVVVNLEGGNDGLNTVIPTTGAAYTRYRELRPLLGYDAAAILPLSGVADFGLNPAMGAFQTLWGAGKLAIVNGVSVPTTATGLFDHEAQQYTFQSCDIARSTLNGPPTGWLGRYLDGVGPTQIAPGIDLGGGRLMLMGQTHTPLSIFSINDLDLSISSEHTLRRQRYENIMAIAGADPVAERNRQLRIQNLATFELASAATAGYVAMASYPNTFLGRTLREAAKLINANLGVQAVAVGTGGFDSHSGQNAPTSNPALNYHEQLLKNVVDSVKAFYDDIVAHGHGSRVLIATISEFGRRGYENNDVGTDHGLSSEAFVVGDMVKGLGSPGGGFYGDYPRLDDQHLFHGCTELTVDFRQVCGEIFGTFLGADPVPLVCGGYTSCPTFAPVGFL